MRIERGTSEVQEKKRLELLSIKRELEMKLGRKVTMQAFFECRAAGAKTVDAMASEYKRLFLDNKK